MGPRILLGFLEEVGVASADGGERAVRERGSSERLYTL